MLRAAVLFPAKNSRKLTTSRWTGNHAVSGTCCSRLSPLSAPPTPNRRRFGTICLFVRAGWATGVASFTENAMKPWDTVAIVGVGLIGGSIGLALRQRKSGKKRRRHRPPAGQSAGRTPRWGRHPYHDRPEQGRGRGRAGHRLHAGRADCRTRSPGGPALPRADADHRRRQHEAVDRRGPRRRPGPRLPVPGQPSLGRQREDRRRPMPRPTCSRAGWRSSRPPRTPGPRISICSSSFGSRSARWSCR